jgi:Cu-processing system permease protein
MKAINTIALATFRELLRNKILHSIFAFLLLLLCVSALFGSVTIGDRIAVIKDFGLFALSLAGSGVVVISGVNLLDKELKQKTIYNVLSKPVSRTQFLVGKFLGLVILVSVLVSLMGVCIVLFTAGFEGQIDWRLFQSIFLVMLEQIILASVAILFSSIVLTTSLAGVFTFAVYLAGHSVAALLTFTEDTTAIQASVLKSIYYILPDLSVYNQTTALYYQHGLDPSFYVYATFYAFSYSTVCILISSLIFRRRDLP